jgi:LPXTG-motif cell wall-anchored protein
VTPPSSPSTPPPAGGSTPPPAAATRDTADPVITDLEITDITETSAKVSWKTSEKTTATVAFGTTQEYGQTATGEGTNTSHSVTLTGLEAGTAYFLRVTSSDAAGNDSAQTESFSTLAESNVATAPAAVSSEKQTNWWPFALFGALGLLLLAFLFFFLTKRRKNKDEKK